MPRAGLEPAQEFPLPPQDSVSTNSTTWARRATYRNSSGLARLFLLFSQKICFFPAVRTNRRSFGGLTPASASLQRRIRSSSPGTHGSSCPCPGKRLPFLQKDRYPHAAGIGLSFYDIGSVIFRTWSGKIRQGPGATPPR